MDKETLRMVGVWAQSRVASGEEPPWTYHKLKQLAELVEEFAAGFEATTVFDPQAAAAQAAENVISLDTFRPVPETPDVILPV